MVSQKHCALRMAASQVDQSVQRLAGIPLRPFEALADVFDEILVTQGVKRNRPSLVEQRSLAIREQRIEHARLRAGEDVARLVPMELDLRSQQSVNLRADSQEVLELVEDDEGSHATALKDLLRKIEHVRESLLLPALDRLDL